MSGSEREDPTRERGDEASRHAEAADQAAADADPTEGEYTDVDDSAPHLRTVAGAYTSGEGVVDDEVGSYTSTDEDPELHDAAERHGRFASNDPRRPRRTGDD